MQYRWAGINDAKELSVKRLQSLGIGETDTSYAQIFENCMEYFRKAIPNQSCEAVIADAYGQCAGVGILFYYASVPSVFNPKGKNAYLACMYVEPEYRGVGIGTAILNRLLGRAKEQGYDVVLLNSSEMGRPLYENAGFQPVENAMVCKR